MLLLCLLFAGCVSYFVCAEKKNDASFHSSTLSTQCSELPKSKSSYWQYRYCHQDKIEQFNSKEVISLGIFNVENSTLAKHSFIQGSPCHNHHGLPRKSTVRFSSSRKCCSREHSKFSHSILSVTEPVACEYVMDVCLLANKLQQCKDESNEGENSHAAGITSQTVKQAGFHEREDLKHRIRSMFYQGYEAYMQHAFPLDELEPLSCRGVQSDLTLGHYLTLIDSLDTLVVLGNLTEFHRVVQILSAQESTLFNLDRKVSVFETTIRVLGGLLSAHGLMIDPELKIAPSWYDGSLLRMAADLGNRLLPAFESPTHIPYGTVNLNRGVPSGETTEACTAAAGSLSLEFGMLSVFTGDDRFFKASRKSLRALYELRSPNFNLFGRHVDISTGHWTEQLAGIGSNIDSVYEYYLKHYILFGDDDMLHMFDPLYEGVIRHLRTFGSRFYHETEMKTGKVVRRFASALQAFWPGLQVLAGDVVAATMTLNGFLAIAEEFDFLPEDFDLVHWQPVRVGHGGSPSYLLRPELVESVFYVHHATKDDAWLEAGKKIVLAVETHCAVPSCGFASIKDVSSKERLDSMPSFFLSEWIKYAYLLFDHDNFLNQGNWLFTTEAHMFRVSRQTQRVLGNTNEDSTSSRRATRAKEKANLAFIPSLDQEEDSCADFSRMQETYYQHISPLPVIRPFALLDGPTAAEATGKVVVLPPPQQEHRVTGVLPNVGPFEITSTHNSFSVFRTDPSQERLLISNLDSTTAMVNIGLKSPPIFVPLSEDRTTLVFGSRCVFSVVDPETCSVQLLPWETHISTASIITTSPCSVADGFGTPSWTRFHHKRALHMISFPSLCDESEIERLVSKQQQQEEGFVLVHTVRGQCSFEEKARMAKRIPNAVALIVSLINEEDELFIMAPSQSQSTVGVSLALPTFLVRSNVLPPLLSRFRFQVEFQVEKRVSTALGKVSIAGFPNWHASFEIEKDAGQFKLHLKKSPTQFP